MRPSALSTAVRRRTTVVAVVAALLAAGGVTAPVRAAIPGGAISLVSPSGPSSDPVIDDGGTTIAYLQQPAGHVMVNANRIVPDAGAREVAISANGAVVAFATPKGLLPGDSNNASDVYAVNNDGGGLRLVSPAAANFGAYSPTVNVDGSTIAYSAGGTDTGARREIYVRDGSNNPAKVDPPGGAACDCIRPSISNNGNSIAFEITDAGIAIWERSSGVNMVPGSGKGSSRPSMSGSGGAMAYSRHDRVVVYNRASQHTSSAPDPGTNPSISADGRMVAYQATGPVGADGNGRPDVVVYDVATGQTSVVSALPTGTVAGGSYQPSVNSDGGRVAFESDAAGLVAGDGNGVSDVYLRIPADGAVGGACCNTGPGTIDDTPDIPGVYWLVASDGGIFAFGGLGAQPRFFGSTGDIKLNKPIVGLAAHPGGNGYWFVASDGGVFSYADSKFFGSTGAIKLNRPVVGMATTPSGNGYWLVADDGGIFSYGDAEFFGSTGAIKLNKPIVGMASTPSGKGYWLVASDGGIFAFGDAQFMGSTGAIKLNRPIVGMMSRPQGDGYWMIADDGGVFAFGAAPFKGSTGATKLPAPIVGVARTHTGNGYWFTGSDGSVYAFGDAGHFGAMNTHRLNRPVVGMAASR